jgi:hypothetical protein
VKQVKKSAARKRARKKDLEKRVKKRKKQRISVAAKEKKIRWKRA